MTSGRRRSGAARRQEPQPGRAAAVPAYCEAKQQRRPPLVVVVPRSGCHGSFLSGTSSVCEALRGRGSSSRRRTGIVSLDH
ncbi:hypothetical protein HPB50_001708 [Hyalomma asiaticum]|uniref:Uncharacterized protein n=1 Tax=Hyalomma asiaticum TaxID=266040 RepID=A0ACB7SS94_HYAAI|nr:hypothetical protein HPB50_001708 [Hyalomma asiaticum]